MATVSGSLNGGGPYVLELIITQTSQSISGNYSNISYTLRVRRTGSTGYGSWDGAAKYDLVINGTTIANNASWSMDFPAGGATTRNIRTGSMQIAHNSNGTKTVAVSASLDTITSAVGDGSLSGNVALSTIPRASEPTLSPSTIDAGQSVEILTHRKDASFTHTITWSFQGQSGTIATKTTDPDPTWNVPENILQYLTDATSATCVISVETFNGAVSLGTNTTNLIIKAGASIVPTAGTVTHSENVSAISSAIGAYVQGYSKLNVSTSGTPKYSSPIASYKIEVDGQVLNASSGVLGPVPLSGTRTLKSTVTDERGRAGTNTSTTINVLAYAPPTVNFTVQRCTSGGTPSPTGTYFLVTPVATATSLVVGGVQKNAVRYQVRVRSISGTPGSWATAKSLTNSGTLSFTTPFVIGSGTYAQGTSWEVEFLVQDALGSLSNSTQNFIVPTAETILHVKKDGTGIGMGKYHETGRGFLDVNGEVYTPDGALMPVTRLATESQTGIAELATLAEVRAGTDDSRIITPDKMVPVVGQRLIVPASITGGSADANGVVSFSSVSYIALDGVFTTDFRRYRVIFDFEITTGSQGGLFMALRSGGTDNSVTWYGQVRHYGNVNTSFSVQTSSISNWELAGGSALTHIGEFTIMNPAHAQNTKLNSQIASLGTAYIVCNSANFYNTTTAFDGFRIFTTSGGGRLLTGNIVVYGIY